eukprot:TRINITY_DN5539_c0_g1_i1.p1 TRINITY_DN5539_c0_g1~~TRINITY_DN5539_c0_g1_i1.p1  ORF type:complete len:450 (-),score=118.93 TRINITY_DN5539_c0_g1_i1:40-1389(-)
MDTKIAAFDLKNKDKEGYIMKCGGSYKTWKKRWLVLSNSILYYYKNNTDKAQKGIIDLRKVNKVESRQKLKNNNDGFILFHEKREYPIYSTSKENMEWIEIIQKTIDKKTTNNQNTTNKENPQQTNNTDNSSKKTDSQGVKIDEKITSTNLKEKLMEIKNIISTSFFKESPNQIDFWNIWKQNIPLKEGNKDDPIQFEIVCDAKLNRICWKASGLQQSFIQKMVDFFNIVGSPESEIDRLNDVGALINPKLIGSWVEESSLDGMDGGWFFLNQTPLSFTLSSLDSGDHVSIMRDWADKNNITHSLYLSRDVGAESPRITEMRFKLPGDDVSSQLKVALSTFEKFEFPQMITEEAIKMIETGTKAEMLISISIADDEFVKIGILQPITNSQQIEQMCQLFGKNSFSSIQKLQKFINFSDNSSFIEYMVLKEGFGFGVYQEGFNALFHFVL